MENSFFAIGDITSDSFITLEDAEVLCDIDKENCKICMRWGDKIPFKDVNVVHAVGNSANAAVSANKLGIKTGLLSGIGDDEGGDNTIRTLEMAGISTDHILREKGKKTNHHYVLSYNAERTILVKHEEFSYSLPHVSPKMIYLSSLGPGTQDFHLDICNWTLPKSTLVFQPGTFQINLGYDALERVYRRADIFIANKEEVQRIFKTEESSIEKLLSIVQDGGPSIALITDGVKGAYMRTKEGENYHVPLYPDPAPPKERTGAGDAFASTFASYILKGMSPEESLLRAPINSMAVVQKIGAQAGLLSHEAIEQLLKDSPKNYCVQSL